MKKELFYIEKIKDSLEEIKKMLKKEEGVKVKTHGFYPTELAIFYLEELKKLIENVGIENVGKEKEGEK